MNQDSYQSQRSGQPEGQQPSDGPPPACRASSESVRPPLPSCCHSGCTVCVLDYPELFINAEISSEELAMLEAMEQALAQAEQQ